MGTINTIYITFAKCIATIVLLCTMGIGMAQAGKDYAIVFKNGDDDKSYDKELTTESALIAEGGGYVTGIGENTAINTYRSQKSLAFGLRLGNYKATGSLTMILEENHRMPASKIALNVAHYFDEVKKKSDTGGLRVTATYTDGTTTICDITIDSNANGKKGSTTDRHEVRLVPEKTLSKVKLESINPNYGRVYCKNLTIYSAPILTRPIVSNITKTEATLKSKVTDLGSPIYEINISYGFVISATHTTPTKKNCEKLVQVGKEYTTVNNEFTAHLRDLTPGTTYYVRSYVTTNESTNGWNTHSAQTTTFKTKGHVATFEVGSYGTCGTPSIEEFPNAAGITLPSVTPNSGWRFLGWSTSSDAETPDAGSAGTNYDLTDDMTFYAVYEDATQYIKYRTSCPVNITWLVAGVEYTEGNPTTEVYPTQSITTLPTPPTAMLVGCCADEFVGWTISTTQPIKQSDILNDAEIKALSIESNTTFYAVFTEAGRDGYVTYCDIKDYVCGEIQVNGTPVVTSTAGQKVKLNVPITLTSLLGIKTTITGSSDNDNFEVDALPNVAAGDHIVTIHYTPTAATDGIETATITLQASAGNNATTTFQVKGRHLPKNFVIAAKEGDEWVALTAAIESCTTQKALPIAVDNQTTPTKATMASNKALYNLLALDTRYTANGIAVHLYSTINKRVLNPYAGSETGIDLNTGATHINAQNDETNALFYEWNLVSEDLIHYTITNCNQTTGWENNRILGYNIDDAKWGTYKAANNVNQDIFLLPVETTINETDIEVMEWGTNSMVLRLGDIAPDELNITLNGTKSQKSLTRLNGSDLYQVSDLTLTDNHCKTMVIADASNKGIIVRKPIIINTNVESTDYCPNCDVVVLKSGKLTANTYVDYANIYVYPGGKLVLDRKSLGAKQQVYLRGGFSWLNQTDDNYALPEVYLNGSINFAGSENIIYDYYIKNYQYFQFALPYTVPLAKVTDEAGEDNFPVWVKHYNGALRAADAYATSWDWYNGDNFERGIGYIIAAQPRQVGSTANRPLSIIRFPLGNNAIDNAETNKTVETTAHGINGYKAGTVTANNVGWNLVGNPFMATWKGDIGHNELKKHPNDANWDGSYYWAEDNSVKYITIMSAVSGTDYAQYIAKNTELKPFFPFFMQEVAEDGTGSITFSTSKRIQKAPAAIYTDEPREAFVQIEMLTEGVDDQTGLFISDTYSNDIDLDDYEKMFGSSTDNAKLWLVHEDKRMAFEAMTETAAATNIALGYRAPKTGKYIFVVNEEVSTLHEVVAVYLTDYEIGVRDYDLLDHAYEFESQATNYNDNRFTIRFVLKDNSDGNMTGIDNLGAIKENTYKFIYKDKMYIYNKGIIYDATGKHVVDINK